MPYLNATLLTSVILLHDIYLDMVLYCMGGLACFFQGSLCHHERVVERNSLGFCSAVLLHMLKYIFPTPSTWPSCRQLQSLSKKMSHVASLNFPPSPHPFHPSMVILKI